MTALGLRRLIGGNWGEANTQQSTHNSPDCANLGKDFPQGRQNQSTLRRLKYENNSKKCWNIYSRLFEKAKSSKNHFLGNFSYLTAAPKKHLFCKVCARECFLAIMAWKIFFFKASCECGVVSGSCWKGKYEAGGFYGLVKRRPLYEKIGAMQRFFCRIPTLQRDPNIIKNICRPMIIFKKYCKDTVSSILISDNFNVLRIYPNLNERLANTLITAQWEGFCGPGKLFRWSAFYSQK